MESIIGDVRVKVFGSSTTFLVCGGQTMAASSADDIPTQLAALLGYPIKRIRITDEEPPRISVIDLATAITMKGANQAAEQVSYVKKRHPEATEIFGDFKFRGRGQNSAPVARCGQNKHQKHIFMNFGNLW